MSLDGLGLSALQERLYRLLVARTSAGADELARAAGTSVAEAVAALAAMTELGLLTLGPDGYGALAPASALGSLIEAREEDLLAALRRVSSLRQDAGHLDALFRQGNRARDASDELVLERIDELDEVRERLDELSFHSRRSVFSLQPGGPQPKETLEASRALDLRGRRRRIDARIVHERSRLDDELNRAYLRELSLLGADIRVTDGSLSRLIVVDDEVAVLPADPLGIGRSALVVRHPALVAALSQLFRRVWDDAHQIAWDATEPADFELTDDDRRVLTLLAKGGTDEAIAREVGVSVRHLRRRIARLMQELAASSRFEAGVLAARRGWV